MRVAIYARVSTANNGQDPTMQTREMREHLERRGWLAFAVRKTSALPNVIASDSI